MTSPDPSVRPAIVAVIVTYEPDGDAPLRLLEALVGQVSHSIIVDNSVRADVAPRLGGLHGVSLLKLGENRGIAAAQNVGIAAAKARGAEFVILFDQDSVPPTGMIAELLALMGELDPARLAVIGPTIVDNRERRRDMPLPHEGLTEQAYVIASGSLIPIRAFDAVGMMREELFIDYVDIEWCMRARHSGLACYIARTTPMTHQFGDAHTALTLRFTSRPPIRHYYIVRNFIWMCRQTWVPTGWKVRSVPMFLIRQVISACLVAPRLKRWAMIGRGTSDGFAGRMGRRNDA